MNHCLFHVNSFGFYIKSIILLAEVVLWLCVVVLTIRHIFTRPFLSSLLWINYFSSIIIVSESAIFRLGQDKISSGTSSRFWRSSTFPSCILLSLETSSYVIGPIDSLTCTEWTFYLVALSDGLCNSGFIFLTKYTSIADTLTKIPVSLFYQKV